MYLWHFLYPLICWWTIRLLLFWVLWITLQWKWECRYLKDLDVSSTLGNIPKWLLCYMVVAFLFFFDELLYYFPKWLPIYIPTNNKPSPLFPHIFTNNYYLFIYLFYNSHPDWCDVICLCNFLICISLMGSGVERLFMYLLVICMSS